MSETTDADLPVFLANDQQPECPMCGRRPVVESGHETEIWTMQCQWAECRFRYLLEDDGEWDEDNEDDQ